MHKYNTDQSYLIHMLSYLLGVKMPTDGRSDWSAATETRSVEGAYSVVTRISSGGHED